MSTVAILVTNAIVNVYSSANFQLVVYLEIP